MQSFLRTLAWVAVALFAVRAFLAWDAGSFNGMPTGLADLKVRMDVNTVLSYLYDAAYSWIILMVIAEALGLLLAIENNTRPSRPG
ncbi:MAG TPA: hypothetical protein VGM51_06525 [Armatimonadota bacterium]|jgi:uroporphyrinogen-III decarboxylase